MYQAYICKFLVLPTKTTLRKKCKTDKNVSEKVPVSADPLFQHWWVIDEIELASDTNNLFSCSAG